MQIKILLSLYGYFILSVSSSLAQINDTVYHWSTLPINGGNMITGLYQHPANTDLMYARTPSNGIFKFSKSSNMWTNITISSLAYDDDLGMGIEGFVIDKNNPSTMYFAGGKYYYSSSDSGAIYKTTNAGVTWIKTNFKQPMFSNRYEQNAAGERLMIDPNNSNIIFFATRSTGLWRSLDAGITWSQLSFPVVADDTRGITFISIDPSLVSLGASSKLYAGVWGQGIYASSNGGVSWTLINASILKPVKGVTTATGKLYVVEHEAIYTYQSGAWAYISPTFDTRFMAIDIDKTNPNIVYLSSFNDNENANPIYRSTDGGINWQSICSNAIAHHDSYWMPSTYFGTGNRTLLIDPLDNKKLWLGGQYGIYKCTNTTATITHWQGVNKGLTTSSSSRLQHLPTQNKLLFNVEDVGGLQSNNTFDEPNKWNIEGIDQITDIAYCQNNENFIVASGFVYGNVWPPLSVAKYTENGGATWLDFPTFPELYTIGAMTAINSQNSNNIVISFYENQTYYTNNKGATWSLCNNLSANSSYNYWRNKNGGLLTADQSSADRFYFFDAPGGKLWRSSNNGIDWVVLVDSLPNYATAQLLTYSSLSNYLIFGLDWYGYYISNDAGNSFNDGDYGRSRNFSIGKNKEGITYPALYQFGFKSWDNPVLKYLRSNDLGATWQELTADNEFNNSISTRICADKAKYGRFYVSTDGAGIRVAEIAGTQDPIPNAVADNNTIQPTIYPNPTTSSITFQLQMLKHENATIQIIDANGKRSMVLDKITLNQGANTVQIDVSSLTSGSYTLQLEYSNANITSPFLILH